MTASAETASAPPSTPGAVQRGSLDKAKKSKPFAIFDFIWRRIPLILGVGIPCFLLLSVPIRFMASPVYKVNAKVLITPNKAPSINGRDREIIQGDVGWFSRTLVLRLNNPDVLRAALEKVEDSDRPDFLKGQGTSDRAVFRLMSRIKAEEIQRTYMIDVSMQGSKAAGMANMLNVVLDTFIEKLQTEQARQYLSQLTYLKNERTQIAGRVQKETDNLASIAQELGSNVFLSTDYAGHLEKLRILQNLYYDAENNALNLSEKLNESRMDQQDISKLSIAPFADAEVSNFLGINQMEQWTYVETQELRKQIDGLTNDNSDRINVEDRMRSMLEYLKVYKEKVATDTRRTFEEKRAYELESEVIRAKNAYESARGFADTLHSDFEKTSEEASKVAWAIFRSSDYNYGLTQYRSRLSSIDIRIDDAELEAKAPLPVLIDQHAIDPDRPTSNNASKLQMMALAVSFGFIAALCVIFDFLDSRIRTRQDLGAAIGGIGCEPIPALHPDGLEEPNFVSVLKSSNPASFAIRDFGIRLVTEQQRTNARIVNLVGIHEKTGNTALVVALARALSSHGFRVLAVELPTPRPGMAKIAAIPAPHSLPSGAWAAKCPDPSSSADLLPWVPESSEDDIRSTLDKFLASARASYDLVVIDSPSPSCSDIAHEIAIKSDIVALVAKQDVARFQQARAVVDLCTAANVPAITSLLNFSSPNPLQAKTLHILETSMAFTTRLHSEVLHRTKSEVVAALEKLRSRISGKS